MSSTKQILSELDSQITILRARVDLLSNTATAKGVSYPIGETVRVRGVHETYSLYGPTDRTDSLVIEGVLQDVSVAATTRATVGGLRLTDVEFL